MSQILTDIHEVVERAIFHSIYNACVSYGYSPDVQAAKTAGGGNNSAAVANLKSQMATIKSNKGFVIDVKGFGNNLAKGEKSVPSIVCRGGAMIPGDIGGDGFPYLRKDEGDEFYTSLKRPTTRHDFTFNVHLVANTSQQRRVLMAIMGVGLPRMGYIPLKNGTTPILYVRFDGSVPMDDLDRGVMEEVYSYTATDLYLVEDIILDSSVAKVEQITVDPILTGGAENKPLDMWTYLNEAIEGAFAKNGEGGSSLPGADYSADTTEIETMYGSYSINDTISNPDGSAGDDLRIPGIFSEQSFLTQNSSSNNGQLYSGWTVYQHFGIRSLNDSYEVNEDNPYPNRINILDVNTYKGNKSALENTRHYWGGVYQPTPSGIASVANAADWWQSESNEGSAALVLGVKNYYIYPNGEGDFSPTGIAKSAAYSVGALNTPYYEHLTLYPYGHVYQTHVARFYDFNQPAQEATPNIPSNAWFNDFGKNDAALSLLFYSARAITEFGDGGPSAQQTFTWFRAGETSIDIKRDISNGSYVYELQWLHNGNIVMRMDITGNLIGGGVFWLYVADTIATDGKLSMHLNRIQWVDNRYRFVEIGSSQKSLSSSEIEAGHDLWRNVTWEAFLNDQLWAGRRYELWDVLMARTNDDVSATSNFIRSRSANNLKLYMLIELENYINYG